MVTPSRIVLFIWLLSLPIPPIQGSIVAVGDSRFLKPQGGPEQRLVHGRCMATVGAVSNPDHMNISIGKAGRTRWLGRRPHNRGVTMNPIDHPHGGGEAKSPVGGQAQTPWGKPAMGLKTRNNPRTDRFVTERPRKRKSK